MNAPFSAEALGDPWTVPIEQIDVSHARLYQSDCWHDWFARLRRDDPVHFTADSQFGPYWSVTRYKDINAEPERQMLAGTGAVDNEAIRIIDRLGVAVAKSRRLSNG
jgi:hypothetical protein